MLRTCDLCRKKKSKMFDEKIFLICDECKEVLNELYRTDNYSEELIDKSLKMSFQDWLEDKNVSFLRDKICDI